MAKYSAIVDDVANNRQIDLPATGEIVGQVSYGVQQTLTASQQAQARANIGASASQAVFVSGSASDFNGASNGAFYQYLNATFTAVSSTARVDGSLSVNHSQGASGVSSFFLYVDLYDTTAGASAGMGQTIYMTLPPSSYCIGSLTAFAAIAGLTVGHSYTARFFAKRDNNSGPTSLACSLGVTNT